jgi:cell wall-associated NlpC family hydrolase
MKWILPLLTASTIVTSATPPTTEYIPQFNDSIYIERAAHTRTVEVNVLATWKTASDLTTASQEMEFRVEVARASEAHLERVRLTNWKNVQSRLDESYQYIDETPYVYSGSTPRGWDCSGFVMWFYAELGVELAHSASAQGRTGESIDNPLPGDIVVFRRNGATNAHHSGIYIGDNKVLHAGFSSGYRTEIISLDSASFNGINHEFRRVIELP